MRFSYTIHPNQSRTIFRDTDVAALTTRSNNTAGWKVLYDNFLLPHAATLAALGDADIAFDVNTGDEKVLVLILCGLIEGNATYRNKAISVAKYYATNCAGQVAGGVDFTGTTARRIGAFLQSWTYGTLYSYISSGDRTIILNGIKTSATVCSGGVVMTEMIDGHAAGHAVALLCCGLAIASEDAVGYTHIDKALEHWYGASAGDPGRIDYDRYFGADGGSGKGVGYALLSQWYTQLFLRFIHNGFVRNADTPGSLTLDGEPYAPYSDEDWIQKIPEWFLRFAYRSDKDIMALGDTSRVTNPVFHRYEQTAISALSAHGGTWRGIMHWLWAEKWAWAGEHGQQTGYALAVPFVMFDRADAGNVLTAPKNASPAIPKGRFFNPPGAFHCRAPTWEVPTSCEIAIHLPEFDYRGHLHRDVGLIQIGMRGDRLLLNSGVYSTSDLYADYQGTHNNNWDKQSISKSGVPMIRGVSADGDPIATNDRKHGQRDLSGTKTEHFDSEGGQNWKWLGGWSGAWVPQTIAALTGDGGGLAWRRATSGHQSIGNGAAGFLWCDARRAYIREYTDFGGSLERVRVCQIRCLVLYDVAPWPVIFRVVRVRSRLASMKKYDHWNFHGAPIVDPVTRRIRGPSFLGTAWTIIDYYNPAQYVYTVVGGGAQSGGIGEHDFKWPFPGGMNWRPEKYPSWRNAPELGHYRIEVSPGSPSDENYFVCLIMPIMDGEAPPSYEWLEEPSYFGVNFSGTVVKIHKTLDQAIYGGVDDQPPGVPQHVAAISGPGSGQCTLSWTPNTDDTVLYRSYYKEA